MPTCSCAIPARGEARDALMAALAYRRLKTVIVVDEDVDLFSPESMLWALATRVQWSRDSIIVDGLSGSSLDPSLPEGAGTASKMGIDATLPPPPRPGVPRAVPPGGHRARGRARARPGAARRRGAGAGGRGHERPDARDPA